MLNTHFQVIRAWVQIVISQPASCMTLIFKPRFFTISKQQNALWIWNIIITLLYHEAFASALLDRYEIFLCLQETVRQQGVILKGFTWTWGCESLGARLGPQNPQWTRCTNAISPRSPSKHSSSSPGLLFFSSQSSLWMQLSPRTALINEPGFWRW